MTSSARLRAICLATLPFLSGDWPALAQAPAAWRFWNSASGLQESYTIGIAVEPRGAALAKHGSINRISRLTGYDVENIPDPGGLGRLSMARDGDLWIFDGARLRRYAGSRWLSFDIPELKEWPKLLVNTHQYWVLPPGSSDSLYKVSLSALGNGRVLILLPDRVLEFDVASGATRTVQAADKSALGRFISMYRTKGGRIWISGKRGVAAIGEISGSGPLQWREYPAPAGLSDFERPREGEDGEVFLAASKNGGKVLVRLDGQKWNVFYKSKNGPLTAWRGADRDIWVQDNDTILRLTEGRAEAAERQEALSGSILDVNPDTGGAFWVSTTQGIARYSPAVWRTPAAVRVPEMDTLVNSITDDDAGNIWFLSPHALIRLHGEEWSRYALPGGDRPSSTLTDAMRELPDGRLAILSGIRGTILIFDPAAKKFAIVRHPEGRVIRTFLPRRDGFVVQTQAHDDPASWRLETFDGHSFHIWLDPGNTGGSIDVRSLRETSGGDLWIGGSSTLGIFSKGKYRKIGPADGFRLTGAFSVFESSPGHMLVGGRLDVVDFDGRKWTSLHQGFDRVRNMLRSRDGTIWVASGTGVHRYRNGSWILNTGEDGLPSPVVYKVFEDRQGRIWAGTTRGISLFHPEADPDPPETALNDDMNPRLAAPEAPVRFVFSGVDKWNLTPPEMLLFSSRLDGDKWSEFVPGNSASFRKLKGGDHRFEVRAMDRNGNVDPHPATLAFTVLVPWYQSAGFEFVAILAVCIFAILLAAATGNYLHRGRLLAQLEVSRKLDHDRKETLELIARREPLHTVLGRVAQLIASSEPGAGCLAAVVSGAEFTAVAGAGISEAWFENLKFGGLGAAFRSRANAASARSDTTGISSIIGRSGVSEADCLWSREERDFLTRDYRVGSTIPIVSGGGETLGVIEAYWPHRASASASRRNLIEAMAGLAASAIENAHLYLELAYRAQHDSLTRLPNRLFFVERLQDTVERARRSGQKLALLYLDLDRFKQVNDSLGHGGGDLLLQQVASRLSGCLRKGDIIARMGGDEFMLLLEIEEEHAARDAAMRLLASLSRPVIVAGKELFVTVSIGISFFPGDGDDPGTLQKHADSAMYRAKEQGKNRYQCFTRETNTTAWQRLDMDRNLRQALDRGQFELHYQPQLLIGERQAEAGGAGEKPAGMSLAGMEALIRLRHPQLGLLGPVDFIPVAEESGLILEIGSWVLREVCRQRNAWERAGYRAPKIAVNVSTLQFAQVDFAQSVARALRESDLQGNALELEVTESVVMVHLEESVRQMEKLRSLGLTIALDDFGTGYSSLSYLHRLPIDVLKIDRSFIREIDAASGTLPLVHSIVDLAHNLGLCAVAEGVERWSQHALLKEVDCDVAQGYLLSHPLPAAEIEKFMTRPAGPMAVELISH